MHNETRQWKRSIHKPGSEGNENQTCCVYRLAEVNTLRAFIAAHNVTLYQTKSRRFSASPFGRRMLIANVENLLTLRWRNCSREYWLNVWSSRSCTKSIASTVHRLLKLQHNSQSHPVTLQLAPNKLCLQLSLSLSRYT